MSTNITTNNYEAYLLDYMEGNLSSDETEQLKIFVAAQGMDWDELTEELPHLEAPHIEFDNKESLKKKGTVVPLYVKIASVAAAAGLLLTVSLWPEKTMPKVEPIANLKPIEVRQINTNESMALLPRRATESMSYQLNQMSDKGSMLPEPTTKEHKASERVATPLLAKLPTKSITSLQAGFSLTNHAEPDFEFIAYRMNTHLALSQINESGFDGFSEGEDDNRELSLIGKGLILLTNGRHDSFASIIGAGVSKAKQDLTEAATDMALTAYQRAEDSFEETRLHWEEKHGE